MAHRHQGLLVAIEGLIGVGKSTVCDVLKQKQSVTWVPTVGDCFEDTRQTIDRLNPDSKAALLARYHLFLSAMYHCSIQVERALKEHRVVLVESYVYRTVAFHCAMGANWRPAFDSFRMPDVTFLITASESVRQERIRRRGKHRTPWHRVAEMHWRKTKRYYESFPGVVGIDSDSLSPKAVAETIYRRVRKRLSEEA